MSTAHSSEVPNDWGKTGEVALEEQAAWYEAMFKACSKRSWVSGFAMWDWPWKQYDLKEAAKDKGYALYGKPAEQVIKKYYSRQ